MKLFYSPAFIKQYNKLTADLQDEVIEKIELFKNKDNHIKLRVRALHGHLEGKCSFSVNYSHRIVFEYISKDKVGLLKVGNHDVYEKR